MKNSIALIALIAALPGFAMAQEAEIIDNDNNVVIQDGGVSGDFITRDILEDSDNSVLVQDDVDGDVNSLEDSLNDNDDNDNNVFVQDDVEGDLNNLDFDDVFDVSDDFIEEGNFNIAENLLSIDDITQINTGISDALSVATIANTVLSATAINIADIDGSINITSIGQSTSDASEAANEATNIAFDAATSASSASNSAFEGGLDVGASFAEGAAPSLELEGLSLAGNAAEEAADAASIAGSYATSEASEAASSATATVQSFGEVASVAAGALNTATFTVAETAGTTLASSAGETLTTLAEASDSLASGSGLVVTGDALNTALINGSITADLNGGDLTFTSISSVAAGALNTVTVDATLVGRVGGALGLPE